MGKILGPLDFTAIDLVWGALSLTLVEKGATYPFDSLQSGRLPCPNHLDTYLVPVMISLPNIHQSKGFEARRFIAQLYIGKNL